VKDHQNACWDPVSRPSFKALIGRACSIVVSTEGKNAQPDFVDGRAVT